MSLLPMASLALQHPEIRILGDIQEIHATGEFAMSLVVREGVGLGVGASFCMSEGMGVMGVTPQIGMVAPALPRTYLAGFVSLIGSMDRVPTITAPKNI